MKSKILLADIGNTHFHVYDGQSVEHFSYADAMHKYKDLPLKYISVNAKAEAKIGKIKAWENISSLMHLESGYETMGVDRKALCLSRRDGVFVDAGSAITVDVMQNASYEGGYILPGIKAMLESYRSISKALDVELDKDVSLTELSCTTKEQISYGIIASIKALIDKHSDTNTLYFTGGDGKFLSNYFDNAIYDETLVFQGILKTIKDK